MLWAKEELKIEDMEVGQRVWIYEDIAERLEDAVNQFSTSSRTDEILSGLHEIVELDDVRVKFSISNLSENMRPALLVKVQRLDKAKNRVGEPILISYNEDSRAIFATYPELVKDMLFLCLEPKELIEANSTRWNCILCSSALNIVSNNVRICKTCEETE